MSMNGLTDGDSQKTQIQFGFWIVDGFYQSYEVADPEVQLKLRVERVNGSRQNFTFQGKPDQQFFTKISEVIDQALLNKPVESHPAVQPTRKGEIATLEARGRQLVDYQASAHATIWGGNYLYESVDIRSARTPEKVMSAIAEAIHVFESILLLDPENNAAKMRLAGCLLYDTEQWGGTERGQGEERAARAKEYYREVIASEDPEYADDARVNLAIACGGLDGVEMLRRFTADASSPNGRARIEYYRKDLLNFWECWLPVEAVLPQLRLLMLDELTKVNQSAPESVNTICDQLLFAYRFHQDKREQIINTLLPELLEKFPDLKPYLLLAAAGEQTNTNSLVIAQFMASLNDCEKHPESVLNSTNYFIHLSSTLEDEKEVRDHGGNTLYQRTFDHQQYATIVAMALARQRAAEKRIAPPLTQLGKLHLAESYAALGQWKDALVIFEELPNATPSEKNNCLTHLNLPAESEMLPDAVWKNTNDLAKVHLAYQCMERQQWATAISIFDSIGHRTVRMETTGPWGNAFTPVLPAIVADECRAKAGMSAARDPMRFQFPTKPYLYFEPEGIRWYSIANDGDDLWVETYSQIKRFTGDGPFAAAHPVECHEFERTTQTAPTCICLNRDFIWAGTIDDGLLELNRRTGTCHRLTMSDGLLLNGISGLTLDENNLWIAYENGASGAIGTLDLKSHKFSSFTPCLSSEAGMVSQPWFYQSQLDDDHKAPTLPITSLTAGDAGELWLTVNQKGLRRFSLSPVHWEPTLLPPPPPIFAQPAVDVVNMARDSKLGLLLLASREYGVLDGERSDSGGLIVYDYRRDNTKLLQIYQGLPSNDVTAVAVDGNIAWIGGRGFIAICDIESQKILRIAYVSSSTISQIKLNPKYAWVAISCADSDELPDHSGKARTGVYRFDRSSLE